MGAVNVNKRFAWIFQIGFWLFSVSFILWPFTQRSKTVQYFQGIMTILWIALFAVENVFRYDDPGRTCSGDFAVVPEGGQCNTKEFLCTQGAFLKYSINL